MTETKEKTLSAHEVCNYLEVPYQTFNQWLVEGVLGIENPSPGRGKSRRFNREDVAVSVVVKEILGAGGTFERAKNLAHAVRGHLQSGDVSNILLVPREGDEGKFIISIKDVQNTMKDLEVHSVIFIQLDHIRRQVEELFVSEK